jgi:hypothetical protein
MADVLQKLKDPDAVTKQQLIDASDSLGEFKGWLQDRRNARQLPHRMESAGYVAVRNDADKRDGLWIVGQVRGAIYARKSLSIKDRLAAASKLVEMAKKQCAAR